MDIADLIIKYTPAGTGSPLAHIIRLLPPKTTEDEVKEVVKILRRYNLVNLETGIFNKQPIIKLMPRGIKIQETQESVNSFILRVEAQKAQNRSFLNGLGLGILIAILLAFYFLSQTR